MLVGLVCWLCFLREVLVSMVLVVHSDVSWDQPGQATLQQTSMEDICPGYLSFPVSWLLVVLVVCDEVDRG